MRFQMLNTIVVLLILSQLGCRQKTTPAVKYNSEGAAAVDLPPQMTTSILPKSAFVAPDQIDVLTKAQLTQVIAGLKEFYAHPPNDDESACDRAIDDQQVNASDQIVALHNVMNLQKCLAEDYEQAGQNLEVISATLTSSESYFCSAGGLATLDGMRFGDLKAKYRHVCKKGTAKFIRSRLIESTVRLSQNGVSAISNSTVMSEISDRSQQPCIQSIDARVQVKYVGDCRATTLSRKQLAAQAGVAAVEQSTNFIQINFKNAVDDGNHDQSGKFFEKGKIPFQINNWTGSVTYRRAQLAPSWTATARNGGETATGVVAPKNAKLQLSGLTNPKVEAALLSIINH